jgi:hypothetical protein
VNGLEFPCPGKNGTQNFHGMENFSEKFPCYGKIPHENSMLWKIFGATFELAFIIDAAPDAAPHETHL